MLVGGGHCCCAKVRSAMDCLYWSSKTCCSFFADRDFRPVDFRMSESVLFADGDAVGVSNTFNGVVNPLNAGMASRGASELARITVRAWLGGDLISALTGTLLVSITSSFSAVGGALTTGLTGGFQLRGRGTGFGMAFAERVFGPSCASAGTLLLRGCLRDMTVESRTCHKI